MSRKQKNCIMIILIILLAFSICFTINYAKKHINNNMMQNMNGEAPPDMPNGENSEMTEPPEKPDGESSDDMTESPEKLEGESSDDSSEPPEKPSEESSDLANDSMGKPDENNMPSGNGDMNIPNDNQVGEENNISSNLNYVYYIIFGVENFVLASLIIYLIMSKFNKKTFKETLINKDKIVIMALAIIILTVGLTYIVGFITNNYILNFSNDPNEKSDIPNSSNSVTYSAANEIKEDKTVQNENYTSNSVDENALLVSGNVNVSITDTNVEKEGDSDGGDNTSFYGINSAIIAKDGANLVLKNITVTTNATGANGIFSYGGSATTNNSASDGTSVTISDSTITTTKDNSGGIMTTGGGTMQASNLNVTTSGISSAAIRTDRGGGTVTVDVGTYTTTGQGSPTIYSTADITVNDAFLVAEKSEGIVIEGKNSVTLNNCNLTDSNTNLNGKSTTYKNIFLYQSMSGDAADGISEFTANNSKITTNNGDSFYVTNTTATINLTNNTIVNNDNTGNFIRIQKDSWGNSGSNGGIVTLIMNNQKATGNIVVDSISTLDMSMKTNSYYEGTINTDNSAKSITLKLDDTSSIKLTGDSYVTTLEDSDETYSNIDFNGYKLYVNNVAIN